MAEFAGIAKQTLSTLADRELVGRLMRRLDGCIATDRLQRAHRGMSKQSMLFSIERRTSLRLLPSGQPTRFREKSDFEDSSQRTGERIRCFLIDATWPIL